MDEKNSGKKPLRSTSNKIKDIFDTYVKQEGGRPIPIHEMDENEMKEEKDNQEITEEKQSESAPEQEQSKESASAQQEPSAVMDIEDVKKLANEMNQEINDLQNERDELKDQLVRKAAELENIRRRSMKEKHELMDYANEKLLLKMLDVLDNLDNAIEAGKKSKDYDSLFKGMELIYQKTKKLFNEEGVEQMEDPTGKEFNVDYHDALMAQDSELPENYVVQQVQPGYKIKDKVLRHAKVVTSTGNKPE